jgi:hypothetical protein
MTKQELQALVSDAVNEAELKSTDIPAIDLYVDQIINLVSTRLEQGSERYRDRLLTKTMINNYSKDRIIMPIKGKKYNKEQIIQMLCVYSLKNTLSISEIKRLLWGVYGIEDFGADELTALYDGYQDIKQRSKGHAQVELERMIDANALDLADDKDYALTILSLVALSAQLKSIAQAMIEAKFPEPIDEDEEKEIEKAREKEEKEKEKKEKKKKKDEEKSAE